MIIDTAGTQPGMGRVAAVVLTFNAPVSLRRCLTAIEKQTAEVAQGIVVDNASELNVDDIVGRIPTFHVLRMAENLGPAGGYAAGLRAFLDSGCDFAWVMDDDCTPSADALEAQVRQSDDHTVVLATMLDRDTGRTINTHGWCGVLIPRLVVERVGVPDWRLFWWTEDTEYLQWRIPNAGFTVKRTTDARVTVSRARADATKPPWKYYYESRNQVFFRLRTQGSFPSRPKPRHLRLRVRLWRAGRSVAKLSVRALTRETDQRTQKLAMVGRGAVDGLRGRLGRTHPAEMPDRPL